MSKAIHAEGDQKVFSPDLSGRILAQWDIEGMLDIYLNLRKYSEYDDSGMKGKSF